MTTELDVLGLVSDRLSERNLPFMLTGSFALAYYATPRMTRDLDIVVALDESDVDALVAAFESDFYIDADAARTAVLSERMFNLMHLESGVKVDLIIRKVLRVPSGRICAPPSGCDRRHPDLDREL
jgi:hypothetical protein